MIDRTLTVKVDKEKCVGCGACVTVCPSRCFSIREGKAELVGKKSLHCGHCEAVCPVGAISNSGVQAEAQKFSTFDFNDQWLSHTDCKLTNLIGLMGSRRSCRNYTSAPVDREILEDLVRIGIMAPSGTNSQRWTFTLVPDRDSLLEVGFKVRAFFKWINGLAESWLLRKVTKLLGFGQLDEYHRKYYQSIKEGIEQSEQEKTDRLWHGATSAIFVASKKGASCPSEDALLATQNILLAAHAMGLGTCLIGFAVAAMKKDKSIQESIGIPREEDVFSVIALGHTDEKYKRCAGRKLPTIRYWQAK